MLALKLHCTPDARFRIGAGDLTTLDDVIHSDTLFSGIVNCAKNLYGEKGLSEFVHWFDSGQLRLSSAFYFLEVETGGGKHTLYFFPKPELDIRPQEQSPVEAVKHRKEIKSVRFLSRRVLEELLSGKFKVDSGGTPTCDYNLLQLPRIGRAFRFHPEELALSPEELARLQNWSFVRVREVPKVVVDRYSSRSDDLFFQTELELHSLTLKNTTLRPGFFFLVEHTLQEAGWRRFVAAVRLLADEGLGGERSTGRGQFADVEVDESFTLSVSGSRWWMTLGLLSPASLDPLTDLLSYNLVTRGGGYVSGNGRPAESTRRVRMLREGAILSSELSGRLAELQPEAFPHPVYRYGKSLNISFGR